ncbi:pyridoxal-dependent decarboxylase, exosortase A system-associated [Micromonospora aurantiaca]|uniref:Pyridoxal-dependent decarboxylase, exosortase A system-associated n=1 Tax=Micromonospora aurantiaca (nom. illeg.) TaxID=47850 RepID=A0A6N3K8B4_9ACTN|nr:pyridoxal-dependent decarboxylase, exosortase A system-associated [Micromonospora aurantiaca]AXH93283.1 pyridoxal-dependent decarboxylase, exosortase A system-associated [Micromonospora aurantiaca]
MDLNLAADIAGRTPFYLYDFAAVRHRVAELRAALPDGVLLHYAIKANPMPALVQRLAPLVDGLDVASHGELLTALGTAVDREQISFAGPGKRDPELAAAIAAGVMVNVESGDELARLRRIETAVGRSARFALRVNPDFQLSGSGMTMGGGATQFGIDAEAVGEVLRGPGRRGLCGLHIFAGSQNLRLDALTTGVSQTFELADRLVREHRLDLAHVNIGGGLGIPYFPRHEALDLAAYGRHLAVEVEQWRRRHPDTAVVLELGRYLVGEAGVFVSRVVERKHSRGETFLVVDGGMHHHLAASGNFGQVVRRNYPVSAVTAKPADERETVTVVGPLCTPLDTLGRRVELPRCEVGDLVVVHQSGAYGPTASPVHFLGHPAPVEVLL